MCSFADLMLPCLFVLLMACIDVCTSLVPEKTQWQILHSAPSAKVDVCPTVKVFCIYDYRGSVGSSGS